MEEKMEKGAWRGFKTGEWTKKTDVRAFIQKNYTPYVGDNRFLKGPTERTRKLLAQTEGLLRKESEQGGVLAVDLDKVSSIDGFLPGYLDRELEIIVGFQTDQPLKRMLNPYGGLKMTMQALEAYGFGELKNMDSSEGVNTWADLEQVFDKIRKTHNQGVFDVYTEEMKRARSAGLITGLPDAYGRGRIIGDFRRLALYGADQLISWKKADLKGQTPSCTDLLKCSSEPILRLREEISEQIRSLDKLKTMAMSYGVNVALPASSAREAVQFVYFAYLAGIKQNNGAAMSLGRVATFLDIYLERDLEEGLIDEIEAQELMDQLILKLRMVRHLRTPEYNQLFAGDPNWVTEAIGGVSINGRTLVTKNSYRFLHTLINLKASPEPNMTVLWSEKLPEHFKRYCSELSIKTAALQYENDDVMRPLYGDDYAIACCVSAMTLGKQKQFFGARCNLAKTLLYAINKGYDEKLGKEVLELNKPLKSVLDEAGALSFEAVWENFKVTMDHVAELYVEALNCIHFMHDKYAYESVLMAFHDSKVERLLACGVAGLSVTADALSAIRYASVQPIYENGIAVDFKIKGNFPKYGNDDDRVDDLALMAVGYFSEALKRQKTYREARPTLSVLTITSNVIYGSKTGSTPDGRKSGEPFAPGASPMHGREERGALASLNTVAKIPYREVCEDGISNTFTIVPSALGKTEEDRVENLIDILDGYFKQGAHHLNVNVLDRLTLTDAMEHPQAYPNLTIRVSGYAVNFTKLTRAQQLEILKRSFHEAL